MLNIWDIPRKDKRDRCMDCLKPFRKGEAKKKSGQSILRYYNKCRGCLENYKVV